MGDASPRASRRWRNRALAGLGVYVTLYVAWSLLGSADVRAHLDPNLRVAQFVFSSAGTDLECLGWRGRAGRSEPFLLMCSQEPIRLRVWESIKSWRRYYDYPPPKLHAFDMETGELVSSARSESGWLANGMVEPSCMHHVPIGGSEQCWGPGPCLKAAASIGVDIETADGMRRLQCGSNRPGDPFYFVIDELATGERIVQDELGDFAWMGSWPELQEAKRAVLHYGDSGHWRELAEVRLAAGEDDDRWAFDEKALGLKVGLLMPVTGRVADDGTTELLAAYRDIDQWHALQLRLGDELELIAKTSIPAARLAYEREVKPLSAHPMEGGFALAMAELVVNSATQSSSLRIHVESPQHSKRQHSIPLRLESHHRVDPGTHDPVDVVECALVPREDLNGDDVEDWLVLVRIDGSIIRTPSKLQSDRASIALAIELSGATGEILPRGGPR